MLTKEDAETCTANFRPLFWCEHRDIQDLPQYVKCTPECDLSGNVYKVEKWHNEDVDIEDDDYCTIDFIDEGMLMILPATESEYNDYKNKK